MDEDKVRSRMQEVVDLITSDIGGIRTGRAVPSLIEDLEIEAYGGQQTLQIKELAGISAPDSSTLVVEPWDKSIIGDIRKGIMAANIGMNPSIDGEIIRISLPPLTTEDREKYVKLLSSKIENGRVMIRQIRSDAVKEIKDAFENKEISEDERFNLEKRLQDITDDFIEEIEKVGERKEKEIRQI